MTSQQLLMLSMCGFADVRVKLGLWMPQSHAYTNSPCRDLAVVYVRGNNHASFTFVSLLEREKEGAKRVKVL